VIGCAAVPLGDDLRKIKTRVRTPRRPWLRGCRPVWIIRFDYPIGILPDSTFAHAGAFPELASDLDRVDTGFLPPSSLIASAVNRAVMYPT